MSLRDLAVEQEEKINQKRTGRNLSTRESKKIREKGYRAERELVRKLKNSGYKAVRIPVSAPSNSPLPDVFAVKNEVILAFEVKSTTSDKIYYRKKQIAKLFEFLEIFNHYPVKIAIIAGKFPYKWILKQVTNEEDYTILKQDNKIITFESIENISYKTKSFQKKKK